MLTMIRTLIISMLFTSLLLTAGVWNTTATANDCKPSIIHVNRTDVEFKHPILTLDQYKTMYVPVRNFAEQMNYTLSCSTMDSKIKHIAITDDITTVLFRPNDSYANVNGEKVMMDTPFWEYKGITYIPFRFLIKTFNLDFEWKPIYAHSVMPINQIPFTKAPQLAKQTAVSRILNTGRYYLGVPYVWGGTKPSGFDCSGYVQHVFRKHKVSLPRTSHKMYKQGHKVRTPKAGDLVFFANKRKAITHVGIYIGHNQYLNASSGAKHAVTVSSLSSAWSKQSYIGATRVL